MPVVKDGQALVSKRSYQTCITLSENTGEDLQTVYPYLIGTEYESSTIYHQQFCLTMLTCIVLIFMMQMSAAADHPHYYESDEFRASLVLDDPAHPEVSSGTIVRYDMSSAYIGRRMVDIWLPETYDGNTPHDVIYMHDGQMLFDSRHTWNNQSWEVAGVLSTMIEEGKVRPAIVVGIHNGGSLRAAEFFPKSAAAFIPEEVKENLKELIPNGLKSDRYLDFMAKELKPFTDKHFSVRSSAEFTHVMGSSMGGLISLYALAEYPVIFGSVASLSTHWIGHFEQNLEIPAAIIQYLESRIDGLENRRIYFDYGTEGLDAEYETHQKNVDEMLDKRAPESMFYKTIRVEGADHSEKDWSARLEKPFRFLIGKD